MFAVVVNQDPMRGAGEEEDVGSTGRLFLRNLPFTTTEAELSGAFAEYGDLQEVHLVLDRSETCPMTVCCK